MARPTESSFHPFCQQPAKRKHRITHSTIRTQLFQSCDGRIKLCYSCSYTQLRKTAADITCHVVPPTLLVTKEAIRCTNIVKYRFGHSARLSNAVFCAAVLLGGCGPFRGFKHRLRTFFFVSTPTLTVIHGFTKTFNIVRSTAQSGSLSHISYTV
jgi:hypothetical protein